MKIGFVRTPAKAQNFTAILFYRKGAKNTNVTQSPLCNICGKKYNYQLLLIDLPMTKSSVPPLIMSV
jgi:hypothetical protein